MTGVGACWVADRQGGRRGAADAAVSLAPGCAWLGQRLGWAAVFALCLGLTALLGGCGGVVLRGPKIQA